MKKTLLTLVLILALALSALAGCTSKKNETDKNGSGSSANGSGSGNKEEEIIDGDYVFKSGSKIVVLVSSEESSSANSDSEAYGDLCNEVYQALAMCDAVLNVEIAPDTADRVKREVMIGRCDRELSRQAYRILDRIEKEGDEASYVSGQNIQIDGCRKSL